MNHTYLFFPAANRHLPLAGTYIKRKGKGGGERKKGKSDKKDGEKGRRTSTQFI